MEIAIIWLLVGVLIGYIFAIASSNRIAKGCLRVDNSDPTEEPYLFLELNESVRAIMKKDYVVFKVNVKNYIS